MFVEKYHKTFNLVQAIEDYQKKNREESLGGVENVRKKTEQFSKPTLVEYDEKLYLVANGVYLLGHPVMELSPDQVLELPVVVAWIGSQKRFKTDHVACYRLLAEILQLFNLMQNRKFISFPFGEA